MMRRIIAAFGMLGCVLLMSWEVAAEEAPAYAALPVAGESIPTAFAAVNPRISLDLRDIEIRDALSFLAQKADLNIVPTNQVSGRMTLMVKDASADDVLEIIIRSNRLAYEKVGAIYNVMTEKEYRDRYGKGFDDIRQVKVFSLQYVAPEQALAVIDSVKSSIGKALADTESGTLTVLDTPEKIAEIAQTLEGLERKGTIRIFSLKYAQAEDVAKQMRTEIDMKKLGMVKADVRTNQVIVQTMPERMNDVAQMIAGLDQKTREVLIEARIIQVKLTDSLSSGVEWEGLFETSQKNGTTSYVGTYPPSSVTSDTDWRSRKKVLEDTGYIGAYPFSGTTSNFSASQPRVGTEQMHVGVVGKNDYDVMISYLKTLGDVKILSNPRLAVTNNQEARIHVGERQAYITTTTTAGQTTTTVSEQVTFLDVGLQLFLTPAINEDGYVTLRIKPEVSSVTGSLVTGQDNRIPILDTSTAETTVMVKDGATVAVGGLRREENSVDSQQVPFIGRIPILGMLFKSEQNRKQRSELLVLITAHIIQGDELVTGEPRSFGKHLDGTYQGYQPVTQGSDLTNSDTTQVPEGVKLYQTYPDRQEAREYVPGPKPMKESEL